MILLLMEWLRDTLGIKVPFAFQYYSTRMMLAAITSLLVTIFVGPWFIRKLYALKNESSIRTEDIPLLAELHQKKKTTPTMGGALILVSMLLSMFLWMDLKSIYTLFLFITTVVLGLLGARDDFLKMKYKNSKGISGKKKLLIQASLALIIGLYLMIPDISSFLHMGSWYEPPVIKEAVTNTSGLTSIPLSDFASRVYVPFFKGPVLILAGALSIFAIFFMMFAIVGASNAVNLTDGLDGLAAGCLIMVAGCLAFFAFLSNHAQLATYLNIAYIEGSGEIAIYMCAFIGSCLGFLWYNGHLEATGSDLVLESGGITCSDESVSLDV